MPPPNPLRDPRLPALVALSTTQWGGMYGPVEPRLTGLARRGWSVLHSNGPFFSWDRNAAEWDAAGWSSRFERRDGIVLDRRGRSPFRWPAFPLWDRLAIASVARRLRRRALAEGASSLVAYLFHPWFYPYLRELKPDYVVFQAIDNHAYQPGWTPSDAELLEALIERADLLLVNNATHAQLLPGAGPAKATVLSNAVDFARFANGAALPCPADLAAIPAPRINYIGRMNTAVDFPMIASVARARHDWHWVLIGPVFPAGPDEFVEVEAARLACERLANVHFLGYREREQIPAYLAHADVNTIAYRLSAGNWTQSAYPLKVLECLAAGRPVVSAAIPEVMRHRDVMDFADTPAEWLAALDRVIAGGGAGTREQRQAVARANSWDTRIDELDRTLRRLVGR